MGYFALLGDSEGSAPRVIRLHLNLWSLPSLIPGRRLFYFDVGAEIEATSEPVKSVQMLLPFRVEEGRWPDGTTVAQDLYPVVTDNEVAELIFGGPVAHNSDSRGARLEIGDYGDELAIRRIQPAGVTRDEVYEPRADSSLYHVPFASPIGAGQRAYIRVRWRVFGASPLWRWKRLSGGARVDLRVCDVRESRFADVDRHLRSRILVVDEVNIFVMASPRLQLVARSPEPRHVRILEPRAWRRYLEGAAHFGRPNGLLVYYWRHAERGKPVTIDSPFRVFSDFNRTNSSRWWMTVLQVVLGVSLTLALFKGSQVADPLSTRLAEVKWDTILKVMFGTTVLSALMAVDRIRTWASSRFLAPRRALRTLERRILSVGQRS